MNGSKQVLGGTHTLGGTRHQGDHGVLRTVLGKAWGSTNVGLVQSCPADLSNWVDYCMATGAPYHTPGCPSPQAQPLLVAVKPTVRHC